MQKLDFENPNEQNFILLVVATEEQTVARLSSQATLRVQVTDLNDNHPVFDKESYTAIIPEEATPGHIITLVSPSFSKNEEIIPSSIVVMYCVL